MDVLIDLQNWSKIRINNEKYGANHSIDALFADSNLITNRLCHYIWKNLLKIQDVNELIALYTDWSKLTNDMFDLQKDLSFNRHAESSIFKYIYNMDEKEFKELENAMSISEPTNNEELNEDEQFLIQILNIKHAKINILDAIKNKTKVSTIKPIKEANRNIDLKTDITIPKHDIKHSYSVPKRQTSMDKLAQNLEPMDIYRNGKLHSYEPQTNGNQTKIKHIILKTICNDIEPTVIINGEHVDEINEVIPPNFKFKRKWWSTHIWGMDPGIKPFIEENNYSINMIIQDDKQNAMNTVSNMQNDKLEYDKSFEASLSGRLNEIDEENELPDLNLKNYK